jgi:hypothetical protein
MAHFAKIENDTVTQVIVVSNDNCGGGEFPENEPVGQAFLASLGLEGEWKQTSYNANFRGVYASIGWSYDSVNDVFVAPPVPEELLEP